MTVTENGRGLSSKDVTSKDVYEFSDKKKTKSSKISIKEYAARNSILTDLYEHEHFSTIYHLMMAFIFYLLLNKATYDYSYRNRIQFGFDFILKGFSNFHYIIIVWIGMFLTSFLSYFGLIAWALVRVQLGPKLLQIKSTLDFTVFVLVIFCYAAFLTVFPMLIIPFNFSLVTKFALYFEAIRILMKSLVFIRSNAPRVMAYKPHVEDQVLYPTLKQYLYFWFSPATIYQDEYPRSEKINWNNVKFYIFEFVACALMIGCAIDLFYVTVYEEFGTRKYELRELTLLLVKNCFCGLLIHISLFYMILHAWMNFFAELLRFSDRMFYKDWWTSDDLPRFYRKWNVVVHDCLYNYLYKDLYEVVIPKNQLAPKLLVFFISALVHEYILAFSFGFFLPVLFICFFMLSIPASFVKFKSRGFGNFMLWCSIMLGMSLFTSFYAMEYYCRTNTHTTNVSWGDLLVPKLLNCL